MSQRPVSGHLIREMASEQLSLLTLDWYREAFKEAIERELVQIAKPKADPWREMDNIRRKYEHQAECERTVVMLWQLHHNAFRQRWDSLAERHIALYGWIQLAEGGGSIEGLIYRIIEATGNAGTGCGKVNGPNGLTEYTPWYPRKYVPGESQCECEEHRKRKDAASEAPEGYDEAIVLEEVA